MVPEASISQGGLCCIENSKGEWGWGLGVGRGFIKFLCRRSVRFFSRAFLVLLMKESKKRRRKQPGKLMANSHSQPVNLPSAQPLMNLLGGVVSKAKTYKERYEQNLEFSEEWGREGAVLSQTSYVGGVFWDKLGFNSLLYIFHHFDDLYACGDHFTSAQIILCMKNRRIGTDAKLRTSSTNDEWEGDDE